MIGTWQLATKTKRLEFTTFVICLKRYMFCVPTSGQFALYISLMMGVIWLWPVRLGTPCLFEYLGNLYHIIVFRAS